jgi:hypothetical protein
MKLPTTSLRECPRHADKWTSVSPKVAAAAAASKAPVFCGVEVDVQALHRIVTNLGGYTEVTSRQQWRKIAHSMKFPEDAMRTHTSLSYHLRTLYLR